MDDERALRQGRAWRALLTEFDRAGAARPAGLAGTVIQYPQYPQHPRRSGGYQPPAEAREDAWLVLGRALWNGAAANGTARRRAG